VSDLLVVAAVAVIVACLLDVATLWLRRPGVVRSVDGRWRAARGVWRRSRRYDGEAGS
jgi:hypothetical protein